MVVFKKFTSSEFTGLPQIQARLLYDSTANVLRLHDSQSYNNIVITKDLSNNVSNINSLSATNLTGTLQTASQPNITSVGTLTSLSTGSLTLNGIAITATATDINSISGISTTLAPITSVTAGTAAASKALILDSSRDITNIHSLTATNNINVTRTTNGECFIASNGTVRSAIHCVTNSAHIGTTTNHNFNIQANGQNILQCLSSGNVNITSSTASTSTTTGALTISGGLGISGSINIGGDINLTGSLTLNGTTITATAAEINWLDITAAGTAEASKALVLDASRNIININALTATNLTGTLQTAAQPNITSVGTLTSLSTGSLTLNGTAITATAAKINWLDITTAGTAEASKALVLDASRNIININALTATNLTGTLQTAAQPNITSVGTLTSLSTGSLTLNGTAITATADEINYLDITAAGTAQASKALVLDSSKNISGINSLSCTSLTVNGTNITSGGGTPAELSGITAGIASASKALVLNASKEIKEITKLQIGTNTTIGGGDLNIMNTAANSSICFGSSETTGNLVTMKWTYISANSNFNRLSFDFFGRTNQMVFYNLGAMTINRGTALNAALDIAGTINLVTGTYNKILSCYGANASPVQFDIQCHTGTSATSTNAALIGTISNNDLRINTNNSTKMIITADGFIGIGLTNPSNVLDVEGTGRFGGSASTMLTLSSSASICGMTMSATGASGRIYALQSASGSFIIADNSSGGGTRLEISSTGNVGFPSSSASYKLNVTGDINLTGSLRFSGTAITATAAKINYVDITTAGTAQASKALVLDASKQIKEITKLQIGTNTAIGIGDLNIMNTAANSSIRFGSSETSGNLVTFQWTYVSADSLTNRISFDFYGRSNQMTLFNSGNMSINRVTPYAMVDIAGNSNFVTGTYNKILSCFSSNVSPVQFDIQCSTETSATSTNAAWIGTITNNDLRIGTNNSTKMIILANGYVGIGTTTPQYPLHVIHDQNVTYTGGTAYYAYTGTATTTGTNTNPGAVYIFTNGRILASEFNATSDSRIKTNIIDIDDVSALNTLRLIQPKKYNYIDTVNRSSNSVWGFIAQQVHSVLDYAVNIETDYIPNIFQTATKTVSENGDTILTVTNPITFDSHSTNKLKILSENNKYEYVTIKTKISNTQISINETLEDNNYFIYGEQINNLHILNKDAIFTITTAAVQEIDRNVTELENKVELLEQKNNQLEQQIQDILTRLQNIENP
jgi:hypothetical protein